MDQHTRGVERAKLTYAEFLAAGVDAPDWRVAGDQAPAFVYAPKTSAAVRT